MKASIYDESNSETESDAEASEEEEEEEEESLLNKLIHESLQNAIDATEEKLSEMELIKLARKFLVGSLASAKKIYEQWDEGGELEKIKEHIMDYEENGDEEVAVELAVQSRKLPINRLIKEELEQMKDDEDEDEEEEENEYY